jgi:monovalent cation:H+ antiporter, CPA1 family
MTAVVRLASRVYFQFRRIDMTIFQIIAVILTVAAAGGYLNYRYIGFPATIGHMGFALLLSLTAIAAGKLGWLDIEPIRDVVNGIDFSQVVLHGMLSYLLFAGALHINFNDLKSVKWPVGILATVGVVLATFITGTLTWYAAQLVGLHLPYIYALLFGALISPTDPIAVLSILKQAGASKNIYTKVGGESLFNDGVGVVVFLAILGVATSGVEFEVSHFLTAFAYESLGGMALGGIVGWGTYRLLRSIDEYKVEVMLTLALVTGGYALAEYLHVSAPLCMVVAGLIIGNQGRAHGMSDTTRRHLDVFWELVDEILNAVLFLLIGLEILVVTLSGQSVLLGALAIVAVLVARFISVGIPISAMRLTQNFERGTIRLLTWGGLRGGLSIAMALSLPMGDEKTIILTLTYLVVLFSIFVQGLSFQSGIKMIMKSTK